MKSDIRSARSSPVRWKWAASGFCMMSAANASIHPSAFYRHGWVGVHQHILRSRADLVVGGDLTVNQTAHPHWQLRTEAREILQFDQALSCVR